MNHFLPALPCVFLGTYLGRDVSYQTEEPRHLPSRVEAGHERGIDVAFSTIRIQAFTLEIDGVAGKRLLDSWLDRRIQFLVDELLDSAANDFEFAHPVPLLVDPIDESVPLILVHVCHECR